MMPISMNSFRAGRRIRRLPVAGVIPAGPAIDNVGDGRHSSVDIRHICPEARPGDFFLEVTGDSMIGAGIRPGQLALMRPGIVPDQGDICAVWVRGEGGTLKRVFVDEGHVRLAPENPAYSEKIFPIDDVLVQGVLIATIDVRLF